MSDPTGLVDLTRELFRLSDLLDSGLDFLRGKATELAVCEHDYRLARAEAWGSTTGTAKQREDAVNALTAEQRLARDSAEHLRQAALESIRSRRTQISALQTLLGAHKAEGELAKYGPRTTT